MAAECRDGEPAVIEGKILRKLPPAYIRKGMVLYKLTVTDGMQNFTVTIFNNEYAYYGVHVGETYIFAGKWNRMGNAGSLAMQNYLSPGEAATLRPVYPLTEGLSSKMVQTNVQDAIARALPGLPDPIPRFRTGREYGLIGFRQAVQEIHFPESQEQMETARDRLAFEELLRLTLALKFLKGRGREKTRVRVQRPDLKPFVKSLPFPLTGAQKRVIAEILRDMASPYPMNRLLQGDVGSGKTLVAAAVSYAAIQKGYQAALMAPTEILAAQHAENPPEVPRASWACGWRCSPASPRPPKQKTPSGRPSGGGRGPDLVVGTHALCARGRSSTGSDWSSPTNSTASACEQRHALGREGGRCPHLLVMSATPIPRTLALILYGDLDVSVIDELPPGRTPVETYVIGEDKRQTNVPLCPQAGGGGPAGISGLSRSGGGRGAPHLKAVPTPCRNPPERVSSDLRVSASSTAG